MILVSQWIWWINEQTNTTAWSEVSAWPKYGDIPPPRAAWRRYWPLPLLCTWGALHRVTCKNYYGHNSFISERNLEFFPVLISLGTMYCRCVHICLIVNKFSLYYTHFSIGLYIETSAVRGNHMADQDDLKSKPNQACDGCCKFSHF